MDAIQAERADRLYRVKSPSGHPVGTARRCTFPECITVISRYNPDPLCYVHMTWKPYRMSVRGSG